MAELLAICHRYSELLKSCLPREYWVGNDRLQWEADGTECGIELAIAQRELATKQQRRPELIHDITCSLRKLQKMGITWNLEDSRGNAMFQSPEAPTDWTQNFYFLLMTCTQLLSSGYGCWYACMPSISHEIMWIALQSFIYALLRAFFLFLEMI